MCLNTLVEIGYFILSKNQLITHQEPEKTRIHSKTYNLQCDLTAFPERDMKLRDNLKSMFAKILLQTPEAQLLSLAALVPWSEYQSITRINDETDVHYLRIIDCVEEIKDNGL